MADHDGEQEVAEEQPSEVEWKVMQGRLADSRGKRGEPCLLLYVVVRDFLLLHVHPPYLESTEFLPVEFGSRTEAIEMADLCEEWVRIGFMQHTHFPAFKVLEQKAHFGPTVERTFWLTLILGDKVFLLVSTPDSDSNFRPHYLHQEQAVEAIAQEILEGFGNPPGELRKRE